MKITIMGFKPNYTEDKDLSITVPENGEKFTELTKWQIGEITYSKVKEVIFREKRRAWDGVCNSFFSLNINNWYFLWIEKISRWIVIYFCVEPLGGNGQFQIDETTAKGPFEIEKNCSEKIKKYFGSNVPLEDIKRTSPKTLRENKNNPSN
jgi:hypothetical protein